MSYAYLATPYTEYPDGLDIANREACHAAAWLLRRGVPLFCPIAHSHAIGTIGDLPLKDHSLWLPAGEPFMDTATVLVICHMPTWQTSYGISEEVKKFKAAGKPIVDMPWPMRNAQEFLTKLEEACPKIKKAMRLFLKKRNEQS